MPKAPIDFGTNQATGHEALGGAAGVAMNVVIDQTGTVRRRPGIAAATGLYSGIVATSLAGIFESKGTVYAVGGGSPRAIYAIGPTSALNLSALSISGGYLGGTGTPVFAETEALVVVAGGQRMVKIVTTGATPEVSLLEGTTGGGTLDPPKATHVAANASRLLANDVELDRSKVRYSMVATSTVYTGHEDWSVGIGTGGLFSAESRPDTVVAVAENTNEVFVFGARSLETWAPDSQLVFQRATALEHGCAAPYSVVKTDQSFVWLDDRRRFVQSDGRGVTVLSDAIQATLHGLSTVSDCYGYRVHLGAVDALVWTFPTHGVSYALQKGGGWSQWASYSANAAVDIIAYTALIATGAFQLATTGETLVSTTLGKVGAFTNSVATDYGLDFPASVTTGFISRDTDARKWCRAVHLALRRGEGAGTGRILLSWRDDTGAFGAPIPVDLGPSGDREPVVSLRSLGTYRRRQWKIEFSGEDQLVLAGVQEDYDVLGS